jgi:hypothetical protein
VKSAALCAALLLAGPALADPPVHAPAALQEEAQNELWATRLSEAHARRDTARQRELEAVQALGSARHRRQHVEIAIEIVVAESGRKGVVRQIGAAIGSRFKNDRCDVDERAVALVPVDLVRIVEQSADEQIEEAVAVDVGERRSAVAIVALAVVPGIGHAGRHGPVDEQKAVALFGQLVDIETVRPAGTVAVRVAVGNEQVDVVVVVAIARSRTAIGRLDDFEPARVTRPQRETNGVVDCRCVRDIDECAGWRRRGRRWRRWRCGRRTAAASAATRRQKCEDQK